MGPNFTLTYSHIQRGQSEAKARKGGFSSGLQVVSLSRPLDIPHADVVLSKLAPRSPVSSALRPVIPMSVCRLSFNITCIEPSGMTLTHGSTELLLPSPPRSGFPLERSNRKAHAMMRASCGPFSLSCPVSKKGVLETKKRRGPNGSVSVCQPCPADSHATRVPILPCFIMKSRDSESTSQHMELQGVCLLKLC